jgi:nicotinamide mononucleotide transporter
MMNIPMPSLLEISAIVMTTICIFLAGRNNIHTWWTGLVGCILYGVLFYQSKLYADALLQVFFVGTGIYGWKMWLDGNRTGDSAPMTNINMKSYGLLVLVGACGALAYGWLLHTFTDAWAPFIDSLVLAFSVIGQILLMKRKVQAWPTWVLVNIISMPLFWSRDLHLSSILYACYLVHAIWATYYWLTLHKNKGAIEQAWTSNLGDAVKILD